VSGGIKDGHARQLMVKVLRQCSNRLSYNLLRSLLMLCSLYSVQWEMKTILTEIAACPELIW